MTHALRLLLALVLLPTLAAPARAADVDWEAVAGEAAGLLGEYVRIDTTNPPGNELPAARFLQSRFSAAGIEAQVFESSPGRGSVLARLEGQGHGRPVVLLNHLDVVPADPSGWQVPPFSGQQSGGYVHGRGTLDCKGIGAVQAMAMIVLKRQGIRPPRDVIFLGTADEETGGRLGAGWMVENHFDLLRNAEFVLNEGSHILAMPDGRRAWRVAVAEKTPCWLRLTSTGKAGHGSTPAQATAVTKLVRALARLQDEPREVRVTPEVQAYFQALAPMQTGRNQASFLDLRKALAHPGFRQEFLLDAHNAALVRDTITPTVLSGSMKTNVIPGTAAAELDCRLLPDADPQRFVRHVVQRIDDPTIRVEILLNFPPSASSTDTALFRALRDQAQAEGNTVVPGVLTGFTDSHYFREKGIVSYGFTPITLSDADTQGEHGVNERLSIANLRDGTHRLVDLLRGLDR